ncbi:MAG: ParA family protein [Candidatus Zixiibacteriota bacterium]|nr:MAG: ParA family protein [candidate division Zixibacteria bacterium]
MHSFNTYNMLGINIDFFKMIPYISLAQDTGGTMATPYVITISSEKGGVGKTTVATNLAIYLKALQEDLPVTLFSFDNHFSVDKMFRIGKHHPTGNVADLFAGRPLRELVELGQFGVQFIASHRDLAPLRHRLKSPTRLADLLAASGLPGIIIIDTRPDLDPLTGNALYASDRVIVPVKDTPSLENCRNLYAFFDQHGLSRRALQLLPCLVDSRVRFDGPFKDPSQLLKAFAINRGYRCFDGHISKSPKVDSLNTNPEGRIYPIITHGRGTEVHKQFAQLAQQVLADYRNESNLRLGTVRLETGRQELSRAGALALRKERLRADCVLCDRIIVESTQIGEVGYYWELDDGTASGFLDERCFSTAIFQHFFRSSRELPADDPLRELFRESTQRSYFSICQQPETRGHFRQQLAFYRFDDEGLMLSRKVIDPPAVSGNFGNLLGLIQDESRRLGERVLIVRRVDSDFPDDILLDENHTRMRQATKRIINQLRQH